MNHASKSRVILPLAALLLWLGCAVAPPASGNDAELERLHAAVRKPLPLMQASMRTWIEEAPCTSCHHQGLGIMALVFARERGFDIDAAMFDEQVQRVAQKSVDGYAHNLQGDGGINASFGQSYRLLALAAAGVERSDATDVVAHYLAGNQSAAGSYASASFRPPLESSPFTATAFVGRALSLYGPDGRADEMAGKIERGRAWLERTAARDHEERTMKLFGLGWAGADQETVHSAVDDLLRTQQPDGGWAQLPTRASDAYATGQALVALQQIGGMAVTDPAYRRGVRFLLDRQLTDGTWRVATRRRSEGLPYFESGFPHGEDQFLSFAATAWAVIALAAAIDPSPSDVFHRDRPLRVQDDDLARRAGMQELHRTAAYGGLEDLRRALDRSDDVNARGPDDVTALMLAVHDPAKVALLIERGADVNATSASGRTALITAGWYAGATRSIELLLRAGADVHRRDRDGRSALIQAVRTGEPAKVELLLSANAKCDEADSEGATALLHAVWRGDAGMVGRLHDAGANIAVPGDATPLSMASHDGHTAVVRLLLDRGAAVDARDADGMTPLAWAAKIDHGHGEILEALLAAGADPAIRDNGGQTPLDWAKTFGNQLALARLRELER